MPICLPSHLAIKISEKQELLEMLDIHARLERVFGHMESEIGALQVEKRVRNRSNAKWKRPSGNIAKRANESHSKELVKLKTR